MLKIDVFINLNGHRKYLNSYTPINIEIVKEIYYRKHDYKNE